MKTLKRIVIAILRFEMKAVLLRFHPVIIAVTGNVGKTSAKEAVYTVLQKRVHVARSPKSYNSEIGVPLAVLGLKNVYRSFFGWFATLLRGAFRIVSLSPYPDTLILEMGVDRPGDLDPLLKIIHPQVAVVTAIGTVPVHVEYFTGPEGLIREKEKILQPLHINDYAILNADDEAVIKMGEKTGAKILMYGFSDHAHIRASNYKVTTKKINGTAIPSGITFKLSYEGNTIPIRLNGVFGTQHVSAVLAACAVGITQGMNLIEISEALTEYTAVPGRFRLIEGIRDSFILDDSYNASPLAMRAALEVVKDVEAERKIAVLGDMLEIGKYTSEEHQEIGKLAASICSLLFVVGARARFIAEGARKTGMPEASVFEFSNSEEAGKKLQEIIVSGDVVLVKGSQGVRMEKVVEIVMADPSRAEELLVRQEAFWKNGGMAIKKEMRLRFFGLLFIVAGIVFFFIKLFFGVLLFAVGLVLLFRKYKGN